ncbi:hypothetical protein BC827DRAFT_1145844 [Russula dissimulans]|nr:hypothetical protein BC827DRAFT_1145844 [Russula dissimulans]
MSQGPRPSFSVLCVADYKQGLGPFAALTTTGFLWVRCSFVITPVNYSLAALNFFIGSTGLRQLTRIAH